MPPTVGMRFGRYELLARLGSGGMGEVFRARDSDLQRDVAVKFLPERFTSDPVRLSRFAQEARAASQLNHPNIVTIHEIGQAHNLPFIVMELVQGQTLRALMTGRPLPVRRTLEIASQFADGLAKAHGAGIVHRDLKPENVMVTEDGFVKILDFGLAKLLTSDSGDREVWFDSDHPTWPEASPSPRTAAGAVLGTVGYMSPEQARARPTDFRADQFAFGAIVYEMATGRQAFHRETPAQTLAAIIETPPDPLEQLNPGFPAPGRWMIERCLEKDPSARYASTLDLARDLRALRARAPDASGAPEPALAPRPGGGRYRRAGAVVGVGLLLALLFLATPPLVERASVALGVRVLPEEKRVAVLPFAAPSGRAEDQARAAGIAHLVTNRLAQLEAFHAHFSVEPASNVLEARVRSAAQARRALGATLVVTGSVQRVGDEAVLIANIEDTRRDRTVRATRADGEDALVEAIVRLLALELAEPAREVLRASAAGVAEAATLAAQGFAYTPYAEGRSALERYDQLDSLERAIELFGRALERDPRYALAHAGLAQAFWRRYTIENEPAQARLAEEHARRALELDELPASGWVTRGMIRAGTGRAEEALADFGEALERDRRNPDAHRERGLALERLSRWDEAEGTYRRAIELRPELWSNHNYLGAFLYSRGRLEEAEAAFRRALERVPANARVLANLGGIVHAQGRLEEAEDLYRQALALQPWPPAAANLAALQFDEGRYADAARSLERAVEGAPRDYRFWRSLGSALYWTPGERERASEAYRRAIALGEEQRAIDPGDARLLAHLADCHAMVAGSDEARRLAEAAARLGGDDHAVASTLAGVHEELGDRPSALRFLEAALAAGHPLGLVESDPTFEDLRRDPRYTTLADRARPAAAP